MVIIMKMIIDIPDEVYKRMKDNKDYDYCALTYAIDNGIPYEERPHGKWIKNKLYGYECLQCEKCGKADFNMRNYKFCPDCGADMREADNDNTDY